MSRSPRFGIAGIWQETNTFVATRTTIDDFHAFELLKHDEVGIAHRGVRSVIGGALDEMGDQAALGLSASAWPSGTLAAVAADELLDRFDSALDALPAIQGLVLNLHGAMVAEQLDDFELQVVDLVRQRRGSIPIVAVLDLHANPSSQLLSNLDGVVAYRTFPHVDMFERGQEAARMLRRIVASGTRHRIRFRKLPFITSPLSQGTDLDPMKSLIAGIGPSTDSLSAFITPGFPYSDVSRGGLSVMANSLGDADASAAVLVDRLAAEIENRAGDFAIPAVSVDEAFAKVGAGDTPVMLVDVGDNIGGGASGDSLALLPGLVNLADMRSILTIANPKLARHAHVAGLGATIAIEATTIDPALQHISWHVTTVSNGRYVASGEWMGGMTFDMGPTAVLTFRGVHLIVTTIPTPPFHLEQVTALGLDPRKFSILTAKGALAWQDAYGDLVRRVIYVDTPGPTPAFPEDLQRRHAFEEPGQSWEFPGRRVQPPQLGSRPQIAATPSNSQMTAQR